MLEFLLPLFQAEVFFDTTQPDPASNLIAYFSLH
jgi:hypothetical protein